MKYIVAFGAVNRQRPLEKQLYQSRYWATVANKHVSTATNQDATIQELLKRLPLCFKRSSPFTLLISGSHDFCRQTYRGAVPCKYG
jgi:hypothetical protein